MLQTVLATLLHVIVPLMIPVTAGALLARFRGLDTKPLLTLYLYVLSPAIIFDTLQNAEISSTDVAGSIAFALVNLVVLRYLALGLSKLLRADAAGAAGLTLVSTFTNSVNYGLPLVLLAFGQAGLDKASVYVVTQMVIVNTIGIYFAARSQFSVRGAVKSVFSLPAIYASVLALLLRGFSLSLPADVARGIAMIADAYSPVVLTVLGAQIVRIGTPEARSVPPRLFWSGLGMRLVLAPLASLLVLALLGIHGTLFQVLFILASMPVAVNSVVLAERFDAFPAFVSKCIVWTTLASFLLLPVLITLAG
ncbi:AEC family transporter [Gorillibacterium timonense]|uniref:AEC family transporter n=1 Tax=Gorillibacterium timonense TaxID=1689269 RepID=UPI00071CCCA3|nr:AEC family transporter [Gorillibacterium timonense]